MKLYKSLLFAAVAVASGIFTSCSENSSYTTYDASTVAYTFNSKSVNYTFNPSDEFNDIEVAITRNQAGPALTLPLNVKISDEEIVTGEKSVTFEEGSNTATYIIKKVRDLELGEAVTVNLSIDPENLGIPVVEKKYEELTADADSATIAQHDKDSLEYATYQAKLADYKLATKVTIMRDYSWTSLGTATFRDDALASLYGADVIVAQAEMQECDQVPGFYRLKNPYGENYPYNEDGDYDKDNDYYMEIHAEDPDFVYMPLNGLGVDWGDGEFALMDFAYYYIMKGNDPAVVKAKGYGGKLVDGVITFPKKGMLCALGEDGYYYANSNGLFYIAMPGIKVASYGVEVSYKGIFLAADGTTEVLGNLTVSGDAKKAYVTVRPASDDAAAVADAILEGEIEAEEFESGDFQIPFDANEIGPDMQIVAVVIADDEVQAVAKAKFEYSTGASEWEKIGTGLYTDDALITLFPNVSAPTYEVEIEESTKTPGKYRLVNPYTDGVYAYSSSDIGKPLAPAGTHMIVNATDPDAVYVPTTPLGIDWGYGEMSIVSAGGDLYEYYGDDYYDLLKERGYFGKLTDGVISFPVLTGKSSSGEEYSYQFTVYLGETGYDNGEKIQIVLPSAVSASKRKAAEFSRNLTKFGVSALRAHKNTGKHLRMLNRSLMMK